MYYLLFAVLAAEFLLFSFAWHCQKKRFERLLSNCADLAVKVAALENALLDNVENLKHSFETRVNTVEHDFGAKVESIQNDIEDRCDDMEHSFGARVEALEHDLVDRIESLERGVVPDFEEAKRAAEAVNDFNKGLSAIMNFDPMAEAKRARNEENAKGGV